MNFLVLARDGKDEHALERRLAMRETHWNGVMELYAAKKVVFAGALLNEQGKMAGSYLIVDFPSEEAIYREWLDHEPYVKGDVWREIEIQPCAIADLSKSL